MNVPSKEDLVLLRSGWGVSPHPGKNYGATGHGRCGGRIPWAGICEGQDFDWGSGDRLAFNMRVEPKLVPKLAARRAPAVEQSEDAAYIKAAPQIADGWRDMDTADTLPRGGDAT